MAVMFCQIQNSKHDGGLGCNFIDNMYFIRDYVRFVLDSIQILYLNVKCVILKRKLALQKMPKK